MAAEMPEAEQSSPSQDQPTDGDYLPPEMLIKHPLQNCWSLWFYRNDKLKAWEENLLEVTSFETVEDFWALYNHIEVASKLPVGCDYALFKQGVKPMWEDDRNKRGGRWLINLTKQQRLSDLDNYWLETLLCLIGEAFDEYSDDVCGAVVQIRPKGDKLAIWTTDVQHTNANMEIGKKIRESLNIPPRTALGFQAHSDTQIKTGSAAKTRYQV